MLDYPLYSVALGTENLQLFSGVEGIIDIKVRLYLSQLQHSPTFLFSSQGFVWTIAIIVGSPMLHVQTLEVLDGTCTPLQPLFSTNLFHHNVVPITTSFWFSIPEPFPSPSRVGINLFYQTVKYDFVYNLHHVCCQESWSDVGLRRAYAIFILVALFLVPLTAMLLLYSRIGYELWIKKRIGDVSALNTLSRNEMAKITRKKKRAVMMMVIVVLFFAVCWAPFHIVHILFEYNNLEEEYDEITSKMIIAIVQAIGFFNSFNNPVVYTFMNENFKKSFMAILFCRLRNPEPAEKRESQLSERPKVAVSNYANRKEGQGLASHLSAENLELRLCDQLHSAKLEAVHCPAVVTYPLVNDHKDMLPTGQSA